MTAPQTGPRTTERFVVLVDANGYGGEVEADPAESTTVEGAEWPVVRWTIPFDRAHQLQQALGYLDDVAALLGATAAAEQGLVGWRDERSALAEALGRLVDAGRARWVDGGFIGLPLDEDAR